MMSDVDFQRKYLLGALYEGSKERAIQKLERFLAYPNLITFNDSDRSTIFSTERLIPIVTTNRTRVMLLFSNPHPYSVYQGMFLSPNTKGGANLFWPAMSDAGWIRILGGIPTPKQLADICLNVRYQGPFELIFYCYYAFPTSYPEDISKIFGREYFKPVIEPEARDELLKTIRETDVEAVVTFNKGVFNLVSTDPTGTYINRLMNGELISSKIVGTDRDIPVFLTYPTGWHNHKDYRQFRKVSLQAISRAIRGESSDL